MNWLWKLDQQVFRAIHVGWHSSFLDPIFWLLSYSGLGQVQFLLIFALLFHAKTKNYVLPLMLTLAVSGLPLTHIAKNMIERERPSNFLFAHPQEQFFFNSYPSGHSTTSFSLAFMVLLITHGTKKAWLGWAALLWAVLVGISRIYRGVHWPTDVLGGACFGLVAASLIYLILDRMGKMLHLDTPGATLTGRETAQKDGS